MNVFDFKVVDGILEEYGADKSNIIAILQDIQGKYSYLPKEIFPRLAERLNVSKAQIFSVVTFYENFSLEPKGKYVIKICDGTACHVRKSIPILEQMRKTLSLSDKEHTTGDGLFTLETVSCLGACGLGPVIMVNESVYSAMTPDKAVTLLHTLKEDEKND